MPETRSKPSAPASEEELKSRQAALNHEFDLLQKEQKKRQLEEERLARERESLERTKDDLEKIKLALEEDRAELSRQMERTRNNFDRAPEPPRTESPELPRRRYTDAQTSAYFPPCDHSSESYAPRIPYLKEALEMVPPFDGSNIPLSQFIRACKRAKEILPPSAERGFTRVLPTKLRGRAIDALTDDACETVAQFADMLTQVFGIFKTIDQCRGELSTIFQKPGEHIVDFITRVRDLRSSILDAERRDHGMISNAFVAETDALTARSFCEGLPVIYRLQLHGEDYVNPFVAFSHAKSLAQRQNLDNSRSETLRRDRERSTDRHVYGAGPLAQSTPIRSQSRGFDDQRGRVTFRDPPVDRRSTLSYSRPNQPRFEPRSRFDRTEHDRATSADRSRYASAERNAGNYTDRSRAGTPTRAEKICRYCKNTGHEIEECRKRQYNNSRRDQGNSPRPSRPADEPRAGPSREPGRPVRAMVECPTEQPESPPSAH